MIRFNILILLLLITALLSCGDGLPEPTKEGANTFGCLVDGERFAPYTGDFKNPALVAWYKDNNFRIICSDYKRHDATIVMHINNFNGKGKYQLLEEGSHAYSYLRTMKNLDAYFTDNNNSGLLEITKFDSGNKIISGTFHFNVLGPDGKIIKITKGRLDITYQDRNN
jgi:hypothetical protein